MAEQIFLTGCPRSGTTLMEKILHNHKDICMGSQAFPFFFFKAKEEFYKHKGIEHKGYVLGHLFLERGYSLDEMTTFLKNRVFKAEEVIESFRDMESYKGNKTPELQEYRDLVNDGTFYEVYSQLTEFITRIYNKPNAGYAGNKEAFCEEFIPVFLNRGAKVVIIIRDPRDVLSSMNFGKGGEYTGEARPTLFVMRIWRKSVAFAVAYRNNPNLLAVRYEDLARDTWNTLSRISDFLGVTPYTIKQFDNGIIDQKGNVWKGNSSFSSHNIVSTSSIGRFREKLEKNAVRYIESICYPELIAMGYDLYECKDGFDSEAVTKFKEPAMITRTNFPKDYSTDKVRIKDEIRRYELLSADVSDEEKRAWFIFPAVYDALKQAIG